MNKWTLNKKKAIKFNFLKNIINTSFPRIKLALVPNIIPILLINSVHLPRYPRIIKPESIVFTSGTPLPHAYGANVFTSKAHNIANIQPKKHQYFSLKKTNKLIPTEKNICSITKHIFCC